MKKTTNSKEINIHKDHRKRVKQKFLRYGLETFEDHEILEILLYHTIPQADTNPIAHRLISKFGSLNGVFEASIESLVDVEGIGESSALLIKLFTEIMLKYNTNKIYDMPVLSNQLVAIKYIRGLYNSITTEVFYVICLNAKNKVIRVKKLAEGSATRVELNIRDLTKLCIEENCERIIIAHNHPQADAKPSQDDINLTSTLCNSCMLNGIKILDHIIIAPHDDYSFGQAGIMKQLTDINAEQLKQNISKRILDKLSSNINEYEIIPRDKKD